jgi:flagellar motility protein MotE (MotC chaperone)
LTKTAKPASPPRLLPALMVTAGVLLSLKAIAFAADSADATKSEPKSAAAAPSAGSGAPSSSPPDQPPATAEAGQACESSFAQTAGLSPSEVQILQSLGSRRQAIEERASELDTKQELVAAAERRIDQRVAELQQLENRIKTLLGQVDDEEAKQMAGLVDVYQRMRAKDAAAVFDGLDDEVLLEVAKRMKEQNLAEIMGKMQPERARALTQMLAKRAQIDRSALTKKPSA